MCWGGWGLLALRAPWRVGGVWVRLAFAWAAA